MVFLPACLQVVREQRKKNKSWTVWTTLLTMCVRIFQFFVLFSSVGSSFPCSNSIEFDFEKQHNNTTTTFVVNQQIKQPVWRLPCPSVFSLSHSLLLPSSYIDTCCCCWWWSVQSSTDFETKTKEISNARWSWWVVILFSFGIITDFSPSDVRVWWMPDWLTRVLCWGRRRQICSCLDKVIVILMMVVFGRLFGLWVVEGFSMKEGEWWHWKVFCYNELVFL